MKPLKFKTSNCVGCMVLYDYIKNLSIFSTHFYSDCKVKHHSKKMVCVCVKKKKKKMVNALEFESLSYIFLKDSFVSPI